MSFDITLKQTTNNFNINLSSGLIKYYDGSNFVKKPVKYWNGSSWQVKPIKYWDGSNWIETS